MGMPPNHPLIGAILRVRSAPRNRAANGIRTTGRLSVKAANLFASNSYVVTCRLLPNKRVNVGARASVGKLALTNRRSGGIATSIPRQEGLVPHAPTAVRR